MADQENVAAVPPVDEKLTVPHHFEMEEEPTSRKGKEKWGNSFQFYLAGISCGLVFDMWRFHYMMYRNGGTPFLFAYIFWILVISVPLFYLETCLGQFWGKGPFHIYKFCPLFRGIGLAQVILAGMTAVYTNMYLVLVVYYTFASLSSTLPWTGCDHSWNTPYCLDGVGNISSSGFTTSQSMEYYERKVLQMSEGINNLGSLRWEMFGCMVAVSILLFAALFFGVRVFGKILYVTVPLALFILGILFFRGVTLPGASEGLKFLFYPDWARALSLQFWLDAFNQAWWSSAVIYGVIPTIASYNEFNKPCLRLSYAVCISMVVLNIVAAMVMMSFTGALAWMKGLSFHDVADTGPTLLFSIMTEILASLPAAQFWCFVFFFMMFLLLMTDKILMMEVVIKTVMDCLTRQTWQIRMAVVGVALTVVLVFTLPFLTQGGVFVVTLFDWYIWKVAPTLLVILELATVTWIYGLDQFSADIKMMTGLRPPVVFKFFWAIIIPILFMCLYTNNQRYQGAARFREYIFPEYTEHLGYFISVVPMLVIPVCALVRLIRSWRQSPLDPELDMKPATDNWAEYDAKQRRMARSVPSNLRAIFRT